MLSVYVALRLDVVSYIEVVMSSVQKCDDMRIGCQDIFSEYNLTQKVRVMSYNSGCDISGEIVMTKIQWV